MRRFLFGKVSFYRSTALAYLLYFMRLAWGMEKGGNVFNFFFWTTFIFLLALPIFPPKKRERDDTARDIEKGL